MTEHSFLEVEFTNSLRAEDALM